AKNMACGDLPRRTGNKHWTALLLLLALLLPLATAFYDVCLAPPDCHSLSESEAGNVDIAGFISALPQCVFACVPGSGIDVAALYSTMSLPSCQSMSFLMTCAVAGCEQDAIERTTFCLLQDVLGNACAEDAAAGVVYDDGTEPIEDM
ncbi:hypothetical protein TeGR_g4708, partial [Tetraparma gracilis]